MQISYHISDLVRCRRTDLTTRRMRKIDYYYATAFLPILGVLAGAFLLFKTKHDLVFLWMILIAGSFLSKVKTYTKFYQQIFYPPGVDETPRLVNLTLTPEGMEEKTAGVTSFAPWSSVMDAEILGDLLVIRLSSKQEAVLPRNSPPLPPLNLEEILEYVLKLKSAP